MLICMYIAHDFGEVEVGHLELCSMLQDKREDGFYHTLTRIEIPFCED
jgi:hypothetical protein